MDHIHQLHCIHYEAVHPHVYLHSASPMHPLHIHPSVYTSPSINMSYRVILYLVNRPMAAQMLSHPIRGPQSGAITWGKANNDDGIYDRIYDEQTSSSVQARHGEQEDAR